MRYVDVDDQFVANILKANKIVSPNSEITESAVAIVEEAEEAHACPLCESELDAPISEASMQECIDFVVATLEEASQLEGEMLSEEKDKDEDEEDEEDEDAEDEDEDEDQNSNR